jgi:hypothetical protein
LAEATRDKISYSEFADLLLDAEAIVVANARRQSHQGGQAPATPAFEDFDFTASSSTTNPTSRLYRLGWLNVARALLLTVNSVLESPSSPTPWNCMPAKRPVRALFRGMGLAGDHRSRNWLPIKQPRQTRKVNSDPSWTKLKFAHLSPQKAGIYSTSSHSLPSRR